jgi:hypothetical protein
MSSPVSSLLGSLLSFLATTLFIPWMGRIGMRTKTGSAPKEGKKKIESKYAYVDLDYIYTARLS